MNYIIVSYINEMVLISAALLMVISEVVVWTWQLLDFGKA